MPDLSAVQQLAGGVAPVAPPAPDPVTQATSLAAGNDHLVAVPQLLGGLMAAQATPQQAQAVNQFIAGNKSQAAASAINATAPKKKGWSLNPLKDVGRVWHDATHNPVMDGLGKAMNFTQSAATLSLQAITSNPTKFQNRMSEEMRAVGYDPNNFFSSAAYLASGRANLDLNDLYENYDEGQVNKAIQVANMSKEDFDKATATDPSLDALTQTKDFQTLVDQVNARRATFGNWVLEPANPKQDVGGKARQFTAGAIDTVVSLKLDPTLIAGESYKTYKLSKIAVGGVSGGEKAYQILTAPTKFDALKVGDAGAQVRNGFQSLIDNTKAMREAADGKNDAAMAAAQARINQLTPGLKHLVPDFIGSQQAKGIDEAGNLIFGAGAPITSLGEAAEYLHSKEHMVRLFAGRAGSESGIMPGQLSRLGARQVRAGIVSTAISHGVTSQAKKRAEKLAQIDLRKPGVAGRIIPSPDDRALVHSGEDLSEAELAKGTGGLSSQDRATASRLGDATYALRGGGSAGHRIMQSLAPGAASARFKLAAQRWTSYLNKSSTIDITDPAASEQIFRASNMYMTRSDAYLAQAKYNLADEGTRKAIAHGVALQSLHAAGLGTSAAGREYIAKFDNEFTDNRYSVTAGTFADPVTGEPVDRALFPSQIQNKVTLPTFTELQQHAAKLGIMESTVGTILNSKRVDALLKVTRLGWITNFSNAVRNAGEDLVGAWARGELGDVMRARAAAAQLGLLPSKTKTGQRIASLAPIARTMQFYRHALTATSGEGGSVASALGLFVRDATIGAPSERLGLKYLHSLDQEEMREKARDYVNLQQSSLMDPGGAAEMQKISNDGFIPTRLTMNARNGFKPQSTEALEGAQRFANTLASVYNGNKALADKILEHLGARSSVAAKGVTGQAALDATSVKLKRAPNGHYGDYTGEELTAPAATGATPVAESKDVVQARVKNLLYQAYSPARIGEARPIQDVYNAMPSAGVSERQRFDALRSLIGEKGVKYDRAADTITFTKDYVPAKLPPAPATASAAGSVRVLSEYEGVEFQQTNGALRGGGGTPEARARIHEIDKSMKASPLKHDIVVHRSIRSGHDVFGDKWYGNVVNDAEKDPDKKWEAWEAGQRPDLTGATFGDKGYQSTSANKDALNTFDERNKRLNSPEEGEPLVMHMHVPAGTHAVQLGDMNDSAEILLQHGLPMKVIKDNGVKDGIRHLDVQVLTPGAHQPATLDDVVQTLRQDKRLDKMTRAGVYRTPDGVDVKVGKDRDGKVIQSEQDEAHRQLAQKQVNEFKYLTEGQDGTVNQKLVNYLQENGKAPSASWIQDNIQDEMRPENVLAPVWEAVPREPGTTGLLSAIADLGGKGYQAIVEKPITRWSTMPIFLANYGKERHLAEAWEQTLVDGGLSAKAADHAAQEIGMDAAWTRTMKYIDDPGLRTQMDVVGRNFFAFQRATTAFIRRWSTQLVEDPTRARKLMLAYEGAISTGFLYTDANGQKQFVFPGSGAAIEAITKVSSLIPGLNIPYIPGAMPNLTSQFAFLNPGLQNPMQFSLTPIANIPLHVVEKLNPNHREAIDSVDTFLNGTQGQGQSFVSQFEPTALKKFTDAVNGDDKDSMMADATRRAMVTLEAAGKVPPPGADGATKQKFITDLQTQVRNQLLLRAVFGFFAPAAPSQPTEENDDTKADWFFAAHGVHGLDDEYKQMINDLGFQAANVRWAQIHPDKLMFTQSQSVSTSKSATIQATKQSQNWLEANTQFMKDYSGVGAYFVPQADQTGDFDLGAYNAEFEMGLRQHKSTKDFYDDVTNANASALFFQSLNARDAMIQKDPDNAKQIKSDFSDWEQAFYAMHPGYQAGTQQDFTTVQNTAQDQIAQLRRMVADPSLPTAVPRAQVELMVQSYDNYHALIGQYPGQTNAAVAQRQQISAGYNDWMQQFVKTNPSLGGLFTGVFRPVDPQVLDPIGSAV